MRVHTGAAADASARAVDALAYTIGNDIVFRSGYFAPSSHDGQRLLAHELVHTQQQSSSASPDNIARTPSGFVVSHPNDPAEREATRLADALVGPGDPDRAKPHERAGGATVHRQKAPEPKSKQPTAEEKAHAEALAVVGSVETNWSRLRDGASRFDVLKGWVDDGDAVIKLIRTHTDGWFNARAAGDQTLAQAYLLAAKSDKITYDFIAWHVVVYVNLLDLKPQMESLIQSFAHDDRAFTGRPNAERIVREFKQTIDGVPADQSAQLAFIRVDVPLVVHEGASNKQTLTVSSPAIGAKVESYFVQRTTAMIGLQVKIQRGNEVVNQFLDTARHEGFVQAIDAVEQYLKVKSEIKKLSPEVEPNPNPTEEEHPEPFPIPFPFPDVGDDKKRRQRRYPICWPVVLGPPHSMRFVRTKAERDEDEAKQARMALEWRRFRDPDFDPTKYHVHHVDPLFLGGPDDLTRNAVTLEKGMHLRGHARLRKQPQMATPPAGLPPLPDDLYKHPVGTPYELAGFKEEADEVCP